MRKTLNHFRHNLIRLPLRWWRIGLALLILVIAGGAAFVIIGTKHAPVALAKLTSEGITNGQPIPEKYTCEGENLNPPFAFSEQSADTKSFALLMEDVTANNLVHWVVWNIPAATTSIVEGIRPPGTVARSFDGGFKYSGPCPPKGEKHPEERKRQPDQQPGRQGRAHEIHREDVHGFLRRGMAHFMPSCSRWAKGAP
jgi:phosphatidylethanolamine-binding protein (PEBP) family uncharacterized protein